MDMYNCSSIFIVSIFSLWFQEVAATSDGKIEVMAVCHFGHRVNLTNVKLDTSKVASILTVQCTCSIQPSDTSQSGNVGLEVVSGLENLDRSKFNFKDVTINNTLVRSKPTFINMTENIYFTKDTQSINNGTRVLIKANFTFNIFCHDHNDRDITRIATSVRQTVGWTDNLPTEMETFSKASDAVKLSTTTVHLQDKLTEKLQTTNEPKWPSWLIYKIGTIVGGIVIVGTAVTLIVKRTKKQREVKQRDCDNGSIHEMEKDSTYQERRRF